MTPPDRPAPQPAPDPEAEQLRVIADELTGPRRMIVTRAADNLTSLRAQLAAMTDCANDWTRRAGAASRRVAELEAALREIRDRHIPDQPSALDIDEDVYLKRQYAELRRIAAVALNGGTT